jgi:hypothetical protein
MAVVDAAKRGQQTFAPATPPAGAAVTCADFAFLAEVARACGGVASLPTSPRRSGRPGAGTAGVALGGAPLPVVSRAVPPLARHRVSSARAMAARRRPRATASSSS